MRNAADAERIRRLAHELGRVVAPGTRMHLTGGATAVLEGWRDEPDSDAALSRIKDLSVNLAEGIALSHKLMQFVGAARPH